MYVHCATVSAFTVHCTLCPAFAMIVHIVSTLCTAPTHRSLQIALLEYVLRVCCALHVHHVCQKGIGVRKNCCNSRYLSPAMSCWCKELLCKKFAVDINLYTEKCLDVAKNCVCGTMVCKKVADCSKYWEQNCYVYHVDQYMGVY